MPRGKDSLKHQVRKKALEGLTDNDSIAAYRRSADAFSSWAKEQGIKDLSAVTVDVIQHYEVYLEQRPEQYSPSTIHSKLVAICRATGINMKEIRKPKRTSGKIVRGRSESKTGRGERELADPRYSRLVELQRCAGIRRAELTRLQGNDLIEDHGSMYIRVKKGKGGKSTLQYILPEDRTTVREIFRGIKPDEPVFSADEIPLHANLHGLRAQHAKRCYSYYCTVLQDRPDRAAHLRAILLKRWEKGHAELLRTDPRRYQYARSKFIRDMDSRPLQLRGENRQKAEALGLPVVYDRLALMAVSVCHLSHWRLDVTVTNYMITP